MSAKGFRGLFQGASGRYFCLLMALALFVIVEPVAGETSQAIETNYSFDIPQVEPVKIDDQVFDRIMMPGAPNSGQIGQPALPSLGARILLPYGTDVGEIEITCGEKVFLGDEYFIEPVEQPFILSSMPEDFPPLSIDSSIYSSKNAYPLNKYERVGIQYFRGYRVLIIQLFPVEYVPMTGELFYYRDMSVKIRYTASGKSHTLLRSISPDQDEISAWVDNPDDVSSYPAASVRGADGYDMLIITTSSLADAFLPLKDYHDTTGVVTEIHTLSQIGSSNPIAVRDYIRQEYLNNGIQYVLIGGDDDLIPALDVYVVSWEGPDAVTDYSLPGDFYFSCLDGTYNYDNDALWGEPTDGEGGGEIDLFPEVHVGRFGANSTQEIDNLVTKTLAYLSSEGQYLEDILLAGEQLGFGGLGEYGGYAMDEMVDYSDAHGFMTFGFPDDVYDIQKLYDVLAQPSNHWYASEMIAQINAGFHIIDHLGHSGPGYAMRTDTSMLRQQLVNTDYCFIYAEGCSAGQFDLTDCWAEYVTTVLPNGAFGCIANCRLGLGSRSTAHPVHVFNREFWDAIYNADEAKPELGRAMSDARADHIYHINSPGVRWTFYEITLFGDPAAAIKSSRSMAISFPDDIPELIEPYSEVSFLVQATGIGTGEPVSGSGQLHCIVNKGELETTAMVEVSPDLYEATLPAVSCGSSLEFYVSIEESVGGRYYSPDPMSPNQLSPVSDSVVLFEDDFETDQGWLISGGLWERGIPTGQGGEELQYPVPDPTEGCRGPNVMGYNLDGDYENNLPQTYIISPEIDCSSSDNVHLKFCRWLGVEQPVYDKSEILVSNDGVNWTEVWSNYAVIVDLEWAQVEYDISDIAAGQATVYLAWTMGPTDGGLRYIGWNIDDVRVMSYICESILFGDANGDDDINVADAVHVINYVFKGGPAPDPLEIGDANCDATVNVADAVYLINYIFKGGPAPGCF